MEKYIWLLLALPVVWFTFSITFQIFRLVKLWLALKISELTRRFV